MTVDGPAARLSSASFDFRYNVALDRYRRRIRRIGNAIKDLRTRDRMVSTTSPFETDTRASASDPVAGPRSVTSF